MAKSYKHIYHFANFQEGYESLKSYRNHNLTQKIHIVISSYNYRMKSRYVLKNMRTSIRKFFFIRNFRKLRRLRNVSIQFVDDVNTQEFINKIEDNSLAICTGFSQILNKTLLSKFTDAYNFHQSLLPFYKGPVPNYWVIKNKEKWTGYSIHRMSSSVDDGEIVYQQKIEVKTNKDKVLQSEISKIVSNSFQNTLEQILSNSKSWYEAIDANRLYNNHPLYLGFPKNV